jgi:hypothetical protein
MEEPMPYLKVLALGVIFLVTLVQFVSIGLSLWERITQRKSSFTPTSFVKAFVVEVVLPAPQENPETARPGDGGKGAFVFRFL